MRRKENNIDRVEIELRALRIAINSLKRDIAQLEHRLDRIEQVYEIYVKPLK